MQQARGLAACCCPRRHAEQAWDAGQVRRLAMEGIGVADAQGRNIATPNTSAPGTGTGTGTGCTLGYWPSAMNLPLGLPLRSSHFRRRRNSAMPTNPATISAYVSGSGTVIDDAATAATAELTFRISNAQ